MGEHRPPPVHEDRTGTDVLAPEACRPEPVTPERSPEADDRMPGERREREALLRNELQHRIRNILATVRSVFARTIETGESLEEVDRHFRARLEVIARHAFPRGGADDLERLVRDELHGFRFGYDDSITVDGPDAALATDEVLPLALAIHELVTNALKFGALSIPGGALRVGWNADGGALTLTWEESGVAIVGLAPQRRGFGREYIEEALPYQIGAETRFAMRPGGVLCTIHLPARAPRL